MVIHSCTVPAAVTGEDGCAPESIVGGLPAATPVQLQGPAWRKVTKYTLIVPANNIFIALVLCRITCYNIRHDFRINSLLFQSVLKLLWSLRSDQLHIHIIALNSFGNRRRHCRCSVDAGRVLDLYSDSCNCHHMKRTWRLVVNDHMWPLKTPKSVPKTCWKLPTWDQIKRIRQR